MIPAIVRDACTGCGLCAEGCGPESLSILLVDGIAELAIPDGCGSEERRISAGPENAMQMICTLFGGDKAVGRWRVIEPKSAPNEQTPHEISQ